MEHEKIKLTDLLKKDKFRNLVIIVGICGILLIYLSSFFSGTQKNKEKTSAEETTVISVREYEEKLEGKLKEIVSAITGEKEPVVLLTLKTDATQVYAADEKIQSDSHEEYGNEGILNAQNNHDTQTSYIILKDTNGNQHALKITEIQPEIKGVVVVSEKAEDVLVQEKIINAMKTALGISSSKVYVAAAKT